MPRAINLLAAAALTVAAFMSLQALAAADRGDTEENSACAATFCALVIF